VVVYCVVGGVTEGEADTEWEDVEEENSFRRGHHSECESVWYRTIHYVHIDLHLHVYIMDE